MNEGGEEPGEKPASAESEEGTSWAMGAPPMTSSGTFSRSLELVPTRAPMKRPKARGAAVTLNDVMLSGASSSREGMARLKGPGPPSG